MDVPNYGYNLTSDLLTYIAEGGIAESPTRINTEDDFVTKRIALSILKDYQQQQKGTEAEGESREVLEAAAMDMAVFILDVVDDLIDHPIDHTIKRTPAVVNDKTFRQFVSELAQIVLSFFNDLISGKRIGTTLEEKSRSKGAAGETSERVSVESNLPTLYSFRTELMVRFLEFRGQGNPLQEPALREPALREGKSSAAAPPAATQEGDEPAVNSSLHVKTSVASSNP